MSLDFVSVKNKLAGKGGYTVTPKSAMLEDLKNLLADMTVQRNTPLGRCPSNVSFAASGPASAGDYDQAADALRAVTCSCQSVQESCSCNGVSCTCESENIPCYCNSDSVRQCACDSYGECPLVSVCNSNSGNICSGVSSGGCSGFANNCYCHADASYSCPSNAPGCGCQSFSEACPCNSVSVYCPCNSFYDS